MKATVLKITGTVIILASVVVILVIRRMNPDMAEMRLFLEYWPYWAVLFCSLIFGYFLLHWGGKKSR